MSEVKTFNELFFPDGSSGIGKSTLAKSFITKDTSVQQIGVGGLNSRRPHRISLLKIY